MDRQIVYPGSIPLDTDLLNVQRNVLTALGALAQAILGSNIVADGLACTPTTPPSLSISVAPGSLFQLSPVDSSPFGSLPSVTGETTVKAGINALPTVFTLQPPTVAGTAISYLVEASLDEVDTTPIVLPYYNAANPTQPFVGPAGAGTSQNTQRVQRVGLVCKPGVAAVAGTQLPPPADSGWVGLFVINIAYGQTAIDVTDIKAVPTAPIVPWRLPQLTPGFSRQAVLGPGTTSWTVPNNVWTARVQIVGGGGGGGGGTTNYSGGGGGAGGYAQGIFSLVPGSVLPVVVGTGGAGAAAGATGGTGGTTSFSTLLNATGGNGGGSANPFSQGGMGGQGSGGLLAQLGGAGTDGFAALSTAAGSGGTGFFGGGGRGSSGGGPSAQGQAAGSGGGGGYGSTCLGGTGADGLIIIEC